MPTPRWLSLLLVVALVPAPGCGKKPDKPKTIAQQLDEARKAKTPEGQARALVRVARRQLKAGDTSGAGKTLAEARSLIKPDADPAVAGQRLVEIADLSARADSRSTAREALKQGVELAGKVGDPISKIRILTSTPTSLAPSMDRNDSGRSSYESMMWAASWTTITRCRWANSTTRCRSCPSTVPGRWASKSTRCRRAST